MQKTAPYLFFFSIWWSESIKYQKMEILKSSTTTSKVDLLPVRRNLCLKKLWHPWLIWKDVIHPVSQGLAFAPTSNGVRANPFSSAATANIFGFNMSKNDIGSNQFGNSGILGTWIILDEWLFSVVVHVLKQIPIYFSSLGECCNTVLLWSSRNALWMTEHQPIFDRHGG